MTATSDEGQKLTCEQIIAIGRNETTGRMFAVIIHEPTNVGFFVKTEDEAFFNHNSRFCTFEETRNVRLEARIDSHKDKEAFAQRKAKSFFTVFQQTDTEARADILNRVLRFVRKNRVR